MTPQVRYYGDKISNRIAKTPEGFLICQDVPISRTGYQEYLASELLDNPALNHKIIPVYRPATEVFDVRSLASFEGKPVTNEHPDEDVTPDNYQKYSCGHVQNVHAGDGEDSNKVLADLYITDPTLIHLIEKGKREISCGYYAEEKKDSSGKIYQTKIRGNHVAVVQNGRAGKMVCIRDKKPSFNWREDWMRKKGYREDAKASIGSSSIYDDLVFGGKGMRRKYRLDEDVLMDDDVLMEENDVLMDEDDILEDDDLFEKEEEIVSDDDFMDEYYEDEDEILEDDDELMEDEDDILEDEDDILEDDDEMILEDEDELMGDEDPFMDRCDDEEELEEVKATLRDSRKLVRDAKRYLKGLKLRDAARKMKRHNRLDAIILNDEDIEDEDDLLEDDELLSEEDLVSDDDELVIEDDDTILEDDELEEKEEVLEDEDRCADDDVELTEEAELHDSDESEVIDTDKAKALRDLTEASRKISDPVERKQLQDAIYKVLCGRTQMADVMRITKKNRKSRMDSAANKNVVSMEKQQAIYDSFNPHKKTSF